MVGASPADISSISRILGAPRQRAGDHQHLLLAAGQQPGVDVAPGQQLRKQLIGVLDVVGGGCTSTQVLVGGELAEHRAPLFHMGEPRTHPRARPRALDLVAVDLDLAAGDRDDARQPFEQRGLAGAIGAQQHADLAALDREAHLPHHGEMGAIHP